MRRILAISMAAAIPAALPAALPADPAIGLTRPAPPDPAVHTRPVHPTKIHTRRHPLPPPTRIERESDRPAVGAGQAPHVRPSSVAPGSPRILPAPAAPGSTGTGALPAPRPTRSRDPRILPAPGVPTGPTTGGAPSAGNNPAGSHTGHGPARSRLTLTVTVGSAAARTVTLRCDPVGGSHPKAVQACSDLARSHGDFALPADPKNPHTCFMIYAPVTVRAEGRWHGETVQFTARFPNTCVLRGRTGSIFDF